MEQRVVHGRLALECFLGTLISSDGDDTQHAGLDTAAAGTTNLCGGGVAHNETTFQ